MKKALFAAVLLLAAFFAVSCANIFPFDMIKNAADEIADVVQSEEEAENGKEEGLADVSSLWDEDTADAASEPTVEDYDPDDEWKEAYADKLYEIHLDNPEAHFSLGYINDDDVPELFVYDGWYHQAWVSIYHCVDGKAENISADGYSFGSWGSFAYREREGIIISNYSGMGISDTGIFLWDGENVRHIVSFSDYSGMGEDFEGGSMYRIDSEDVTEEEYYARYNEMTENDVYAQYDDAYEIDDYNIAYYIYGY